MNFSNVFSQNLNMMNKNVVNIVELSMKPFLDNIPDEILINYGIKDRNDINKAIIGNPVPVYTIEKDSLVFTNTWRVPLIINNKCKSLFTVSKNANDEYKIVDFGAVLLAQEILKKSKNNVLIGLLRVYHIHKDFFIICNNKNNGLKFQPISKRKKKKYTFDDILYLLKQ